MWQAVDFRGLALDPEVIRNLLIAFVHHHHRHFAVRVDKGSRKQRVLVREILMYELDVIEHRLAAAPRLVPVITNSPNVLRCFRVGQDSAGPLVNEVSIVIPDNYFLITQPFPLDRRAETVFQKSLSLPRRNKYTTPIF